MYNQIGDKKKYVDTLEEFLKYPDYHLTHGDFCRKSHIITCRIGNGKRRCLMPNGRPKHIPAWGLLCLANCYEAMRNWEQGRTTQQSRITALSQFCASNGIAIANARAWVISKRPEKWHCQSAEKPDKCESFLGGHLFHPRKTTRKSCRYPAKQRHPWDKFLLFSTADQINDFVTRDATLQAIY